MTKLSKRAQEPTADVVKREINKLLTDMLNQATQIFSRTNTSPDQNKIDVTNLFNTTLPKIEEQINQVAGQQTVTVPAADDKDIPEEKLEGGVGEGVDRNLLNEEQLEMGTKVELEHTPDKGIAEEIAVDHLTEQLNDGRDKEDQDYYTKLKEMDPHEANDGPPDFWRRNLDYDK